MINDRNRFYELINELRCVKNDQYVIDLLDALKESEDVFPAFYAYESAFLIMDDESWSILKSKAKEHYNQNRKIDDVLIFKCFYDQINDAIAYRYLYDLGCSEIKILKESKEVTPDISYVMDGVVLYCEVKTINVSDGELVRRRKSGFLDISIYQYLNDGFLKKLKENIEKAMKQITSKGGGLVFIIVNFDDFVMTFLDDYKDSIVKFLKGEKYDSSQIVIKVGVPGQMYIHY